MARDPIVSSKKLLSRVPICEACWIKEHAEWEPESIDAEGNILLKLKSIDVPEKVNTGEPDACYKCGSVTIAGIFAFKDPKSSFFPFSSMYENKESGEDDER